MVTSILIALGLCVCAVALTWVGYELGFRPPRDDSARTRIRIALGACALVFIGLTVWASVRSQQASDRTEKRLNDMPREVADYIRNTTPPRGFVSTLPLSAPAPPTGLIAVVDGDWGSAAAQMASQIHDFLHAEGEAPTRKAGESDVDFVVRSNAWYSTVMNQYKKQLGPQVGTMAAVLINSGLLDKRVGDLAKDPVNVTGIRILAAELQNSGAVYEKKNRKKN